MLIGIVGALLGGFLARALGLGDSIDEFFDVSTWLAAIIGSMILLVIYPRSPDGGPRFNEGRFGGLRFFLAMAIPKAKLESTEHGLVPKSDGWFVLNARDAAWRDGEGPPRSAGSRVSRLPAARDQPERSRAGGADGDVPLGGRPGDFLVLAGEPLLVVEGEERALRPWDFVHCRPARST